MRNIIKLLIFCLTIAISISCKDNNEKKLSNYESRIKLIELLQNEKFKKEFSEFRLKILDLGSEIHKNKDFIKFINSVDNEQLILLSDCENPTFRCFAYKGLIMKNYAEIRQILFKHKNDKGKVAEFHGCILEHKSVEKYMIEQLSPYSGSKFKFTKEEYKKISKEL